MIVHKHRVAGEEVVINVVEWPGDLEKFHDFIRSNPRLAVDTETTGLDIFSSAFRTRMVQFGNAREAYVLPLDMGPELFEGTTKGAMAQLDHILCHNASYDLQVLDRTQGIDLSESWHKVTDTRILAHLIDPRGQADGGAGHSLEALTRLHIDAEVADEVKGSMAALAKELKTTKAKVFAEIDWRHPDYQRYAGMDVILTYRLYEKLLPLVPGPSRPLVKYEHEVARVCSMMERTGFLLDVPYCEQLSARLLEEEEEAELHAAAFFSVESVNSTAEVASALEDLGIKVKGRTPTGKIKVDKELLDELLEDEPEIGSPAHLAAAVVEAKRAKKWRTTWVDGFLAGRDRDDRVHPSINPLAARTGRMSISGIPAQTLPASDSMVRDCFVADPGQSIVSVDYQAQELRVLAALSGDTTMQQAFRNGDDLHQLTADASGVDRSVGKMVNFAYVYGSGPGNIAKQAGIDFMTAKRVIAGFESRYPGVKRLSQKLQEQARNQGFIQTSTGRRLPVDESKVYSSLNYCIQSTARDVTCRGLLALDAAGFTPYLRLPIHDEVLACVPEKNAQWGADEIGRLMAMEFRGVFIGTDPEVVGRSWGAKYSA